MDDEALLAAVAAGDDLALRALFERHAPGMPRPGTPSAALPTDYHANRIGLFLGGGPVDDDTATWAVVTGDQLHLQPPEVQRQVAEALRRVPLVDLRVRVYDVAPGQSQIQLRVEPDGALGAAHPDHPDREAAADLLMEVVEREVREAVAILCRGR